MLPELIDGEAITFPSHVKTNGSVVQTEIVYLKERGWCVSEVNFAHEDQTQATVKVTDEPLLNEMARESRFAAGMALLVYHRQHVAKDDTQGGTPVPAN